MLSILAPLLRGLDEEQPVLLLRDEATNAPGSDPEALIEEARQRQRQRARRRNVLVQAAALLVILGFGIDQLARGDNNGHASRPAPPAVGANPGRAVIHQKFEFVKTVPGLPLER